jgi:hypothetical protein
MPQPFGRVGPDGVTASTLRVCLLGLPRGSLKVDDLIEDPHRPLMRLHRAAGDPIAALGQFECRVVTPEPKLGVSPLPETPGRIRVHLRAPPLYR